MNKILILISLSVLPLFASAAEHCGVIKKIEKSPNYHPTVYFEDGSSHKIFDNWLQVGLATTAFSTKAKFCIDESGTVSIEK